jgi:hypothetical protein
MNTFSSENINNWDIEIPSDFATTRSNLTPPSYSSASSIPSIPEELFNSPPNSPIQPFTINFEMGDRRNPRNLRRNRTPIEDNDEEQQLEFDNNNNGNAEQTLANVMAQMGAILQNMNRDNNRSPRETKLVDIPTFRAGAQDPMTWLVDFQDACVANHVNEERRLEILPAYLKGIAHTWWMEVHENIQQWDIPHDDENNDDEEREQSFVYRFRQKWCTPHQKSRWMNQLRQRIQKPGETVDEYEDAIIQLYQRVDPDFVYPMEDRTRQFIIGLRDEIREQVEIACPTTMEEAINKARAVEAAYSKNSSLSAYSLRRTTAGNEELADIKATLIQLTQGFQQLATSQTNRRSNSNNNNNNSSNFNNNNQRETRTCNKCGRVGHIARNCRTRNFNNNNSNNGNNNNNNNNNGGRRCFICNQTGHFANNCPQRNNNNNNRTTTTNNSNNGNSNNTTNRNQWANMPLGDFADMIHGHLN